MDCISPDLAKAIKSSFDPDTLDDLASVKFENLDTTLFQIVQKMEGDIETKDLIYQGLKGTVLERQKKAISNYMDGPKKKPTKSDKPIKKLNRTNEVVTDVMKLSKDKRMDKIKEITSMLPPEEREIVTEAILADVSSRTSKKESQAIATRLDNIVQKYENPVDKSKPELKTDNLSKLERRSKTLKDLAGKDTSEAILELTNLVTTKDFGSDAKRLKELLLEQSREMRKQNEMKASVKDAKNEDAKITRAEQRREKEIQSIYDTYKTGDVEPTTRSKKMDQVSQVKRRKELLNTLSKEQDADALSSIDDLVTEKDFGSGFVELKEALYEQSREVRNQNEIKASVKDAKNEDAKITRAEQRRKNEIQSIYDKYEAGDVEPTVRSKKMDEVSQVNRRKELLNKLSKEQNGNALDSIDDLVTEKDFGSGYVELREALYDQSREMRRERLTNQSNIILEGRKPRKNKNVTERILDIKDFTELGDDIFSQVAKNKLGIEIGTDKFGRLVEASNEIQKFIDVKTGLPMANPDNPFRKHPDFLRLQKDIGSIRTDIMPPKKGAVLTSMQKGAMLYSLTAQTLNALGGTLTSILESVNRNFKTYPNDLTPDGVLRLGKQADSVNKPHQLKYKFQLGDGVPPSKRVEFMKIAAENVKDFLEFSYDTARNSSLIDNQIVLGDQFYSPRNPLEKTMMASIHTMGGVDQFYASMGKLEASYSYAKRLVKEQKMDPKDPNFNKTIDELHGRIFNGDFQVIEGQERLSDNIVGSIGEEKLNLIKVYANYEADLNTSQQETYLNDGASRLRSFLNTLPIAGKLLGVGDFYLPFVKSPSGNIWSGMRFAGANLPYEASLTAKNIVTELNNSRKFNRVTDGEFIKSELSHLATQVVPPIIGYGLAITLASQIDSATHISHYPETERERNLMDSQGRSAGTVMIGGIEVSTAYLSVLEPAFVMMMEYQNDEKGDEKNFIDRSLTAFAASAKKTLTSSPLADGVESVAKDFDRFSSSEDIGGIIGYMMLTADDWTSRFIPGVIRQGAGLTDLDEAGQIIRRETREEPFGRTRNSFPISKYALEKKYGAYGDVLTREPITDFFFGSRVNVVSEEFVILEHARLRDESGLNTSPTKITKSLDHDKFGFITDEKKKELTQEYGTTLLEDTRQAMTSELYGELNDNERADYLATLQSSFRSKWQKELLYRYNDFLSDDDLLKWEEESYQMEVEKQEESWRRSVYKSSVNNILFNQ